MLRDIGGKPLILHTLDSARRARSVSRVIVATDAAEIFDIVTRSGGEAMMTSPEHRSGSDRVAEVAADMPDGSLIINVQGDEPLISGETIDRTVHALLNDDEAQMSSTYSLITEKAELFDPNVVKAVVGENGYAMYFSRSPVPFPRDAALAFDNDLEKAVEAMPEMLSQFKRHTGLYVYRREFLLQMTAMPQTVTENTEMLEQLRALENGAKIKLVEAKETSIGVDTQKDLDAVAKILASSDRV